MWDIAVSPTAKQKEFRMCCMTPYRGYRYVNPASVGMNEETAQIFRKCSVRVTRQSNKDLWWVITYLKVYMMFIQS